MQILAMFGTGSAEIFQMSLFVSVALHFGISTLPVNIKLMQLRGCQKAAGVNSLIMYIFKLMVRMCEMILYISSTSRMVSFNVIIIDCCYRVVRE